MVVTGGADGIGRATAALLRSSGTEVVVVDLPSRQPPNGPFVGCDLSDPASIDAAVRQLTGPWDALCNVAGIPGTRDPEQVIAVNFLGLRHLTDSLVPQMRPGGAIVSVASTAGMFWLENYDMARALVDTPTFEAGLEWFVAKSNRYDAYSLSKEAVIMYTLLLGARRKDPRVRCNVVSPGPVDTAILPDFEEHMGKDTIEFVRNVVGRHGTPDDIAPVIAFLAGPEAAWVDGINLVVDGGLTNTMTLGDNPA